MDNTHTRGYVYTEHVYNLLDVMYTAFSYTYQFRERDDFGECCNFVDGACCNT